MRVQVAIHLGPYEYWDWNYTKGTVTWLLTASSKLSLNNSFTNLFPSWFIQNDSRIIKTVIPIFYCPDWQRIPSAGKYSNRGSFRATEFLWPCLIFAHRSPAFNPVMNERAALTTWYISFGNINYVSILIVEKLRAFWHFWILWQWNFWILIA